MSRYLLDEKNNIYLGTGNDICMHCLRKEVANIGNTEDEYGDIPTLAQKYITAKQKIIGDCAGKKLYRPCRDIEGEQIYICEDCLREILTAMESDKNEEE